jgi:hypothetical protein
MLHLPLSPMVYSADCRACRTFDSKVGSRRIGGREMQAVSANPHQLVVVQGKRHDETSAVITEQLTDAGTRHVMDICQIDQDGFAGRLPEFELSAQTSSLTRIRNRRE